MRRWRRLILTHGIDERGHIAGTGSAGGIGFILNSCLGATIQSGSEYFFEESEASKKISSCSTVITGEGRIDSTSLTGKSIMPILRAAKQFNKRVVLICGSAEREILERLKKEFPVVGVVNLSDSNLPLRVLIENAGEVLRERLDSSFSDRWVI
jgi:glycerate 2-kinase